MTFTLAFSVAESGDNKTITITDTTGSGATGWTTGGNPTPVSIDTNHLKMTMVVTTSDGTITSYDAIDLHSLLTAPHTNTTDLVFNITCAELKVTNVAIGTDEDMLPDGVYDMKYEWTVAPNDHHIDASVLIDGIVKTSIYEMLRTIPTKYECEDNHERDILDIIFIKGYYDAMIATAIVGRNEQVIEQLGVLERLVLNGSYYSW